MFYKARLWIMATLSCLIACQESQTTETTVEAPVSRETKKNPVDPSTAEMAKIIAASYAGINPEKTPYHTNQARIEYFARAAKSPEYRTRINAWQAYANELLSGGYTEQAISELEPLIAEVSKHPDAGDGLIRLKKLLAVAYLRLGEQANCLSQRNHASCIVPIAPEAQYKMTLSSETAMQLCEEILENAYDEEAIWILNLAAMTIGKYPEGVPEQWRMRESFFNSGSKFPEFRDISHNVGIRGMSLAGGVCIEDFDQDGWLDILTSSWGENDPLVLWRNDSKGGFVNASEGLGLDGITGGLNMIHADINNDGLPDVFVMRGAWLFGEGNIPNSLLLNLGNGRFRDITKEAGVLSYAPTQTAVFADFNLDGWIDLFVGNESSQQKVYPNELYLNYQGTFTNVSGILGNAAVGFFKGCAAGDVNNDGWPDLYLSDYIQSNTLLLNQGIDANRVPQFKDISSSAGVQQPDVSFPTWFWDFNNDGWEDLFVSSYGDGGLAVARDFVRNASGERLDGHPRVYKNNGNLTFTDVSQRMGLYENVFTMGCNYGDLDADGYLDFYLGTGNPEFTSVVPNKMYRNNAGKSFEDVTGPGRFGQIQKGHAVGFGDLDRDGDEDLFESLGGALAGDLYEDVLFENPIGQDKSWIVLQLQGVQSNRSAIGARVKVVCSISGGKREIYRTVSTGGSFGSSSLQLEIGLDKATGIDEIEVTWPVQGRTKQIFRNVPINTYVRIIEGNDPPVFTQPEAMAFRQ